MTEPYSLEAILSKFSDDSDAWVLQDKTSERFVTIPHPRYPGRNPIHFFITKSDAKDLLVKLMKVNKSLKDKEIYPVKVKLIPAINGIASGANNPLNADSFVVHSTKEVLEFIEGNAI